MYEAFAQVAWEYCCPVCQHCSLHIILEFLMSSCIQKGVACRDKDVMGDSKDKGEQDEDMRGKISMKELFGRKNITKDGKEGKVNLERTYFLLLQTGVARARSQILTVIGYSVGAENNSLLCAQILPKIICC